MQLYLGEFRYRCVDPTTGEYPEEDVFSEMLCRLNSSTSRLRRTCEP